MSASDSTPPPSPPLRSAAWFGRDDKDGFIHRSWMRGLPRDLLDGRPVIGICNSGDDLTPCNAHLDGLVEHVERGVWEAGGVPLAFGTMPLGETNLRPTAMLYRNLAAMQVEETLRANPLDGVVLLTGCDKTTPALLMGAASCDLPALVVPGGPMLDGSFRGEPIGSGTHVWRFDEERRAGRMSAEEAAASEQCMSRSAGHCMTMGTASTMACLVEAMGLCLPGGAALPAVDSRRAVLAHLSGRRAVELVRQDVRLSRLLRRPAFENAVRACGALGGSTNAVLHLLALAGRAEVPFTLDDWDALGRGVPTLVDLMPSGRFLMESFHRAGGMAVVLRRLLEAGLLHGDAASVSGATLAEQVADATCFDDACIRPLDDPLTPEGGLVVLRGNLAPRGAVLKPSAASPELLQHTGRAVVFESIEDYKARIDDPTLDVDASCVLVLKGCGPRGYPGMPEVGNLALPRKLLEQGVRDMLRLSDARMSGTAYGTAVLHVAPEAAAGGPLAHVRDGDVVQLDTAGRRLTLHVDEAELARRAADWQPHAPPMATGWQRLYVDHVTQADTGCDLDVLQGRRGSAVPRESH